jgi:hypothetical protein
MEPPLLNAGIIKTNLGKRISSFAIIFSQFFSAGLCGEFIKIIAPTETQLLNQLFIIASFLSTEG